MKIAPRYCVSCSKKFTPTGNSQKRCPTCIDSGVRPGKPPNCACGCGSFVNWSARRNGWNEYKQGHHIKLNNPTKIGSIPWNRGNKTRYEFTCVTSGKQFQTKLKQAKFCSHSCYINSIRGPGCPHWRGGTRTKYKCVWINGNTVKEHRHLMALHINRKLKTRERVHHIDGNGLNNNLENLHLFHCEGCHQHFHKTDDTLAYIYGDVH